MIDVLKTIIQNQTPGDDTRKWHLTREFLQVLTLKIMSDEGLFAASAFVGGTCLRIIFGTRRFSEELDFAARQTKAGRPDIRAVSEIFRRRFESYGIMVEPDCRADKIVQVINMRFPGLLHDLGLSPLKSQKLRIKWDLDTRPPEGAKYSVTPMMKHGLMFAVDHHDPASLFAGKLHACLFRAYVKGRDWYDLVWFLTQDIQPNLVLLNNAAKQTQGRNFDFSLPGLRAALTEKVRSMDIQQTANEAERFLEDPAEAKLLTGENIEKLMGKW